MNAEQESRKTTLLLFKQYNQEKHSGSVSHTMLFSEYIKIHSEDDKHKDRIDILSNNQSSTVQGFVPYSPYQSVHPASSNSTSPEPFVSTSISPQPSVSKTSFLQTSSNSFPSPFSSAFASASASASSTTSSDLANLSPSPNLSPTNTGFSQNLNTSYLDNKTSSSKSIKTSKSEFSNKQHKAKLTPLTSLHGKSSITPSSSPSPLLSLSKDTNSVMNHSSVVEGTLSKPLPNSPSVFDTHSYLQTNEDHNVDKDEEVIQISPYSPAPSSTLVLESTSFMPPADTSSYLHQFPFQPSSFLQITNPYTPWSSFVLNSLYSLLYTSRSSAALLSLKHLQLNIGLKHMSSPLAAPLSKGLSPSSIPQPFSIHSSSMRSSKLASLAPVQSPSVQQTPSPPFSFSTIQNTQLLLSVSPVLSDGIWQLDLTFSHVTGDICLNSFLFSDCIFHLSFIIFFYPFILFSFCIFQSSMWNCRCRFSCAALLLSWL